MSDTLLVTGGAGFIGSNFVLYMLGKYNDIRIINLDKLTYAGNLGNLSAVKDDRRHVFVKGDVCDKDLVRSLFAKYPVTYVVNFAAESHVDRSIRDPMAFERTNVGGTADMLACAREAWEEKGKLKKFLQVSTDEVYGALGPTGFFTETTPLRPHSPYSASKASADLFVRAFHDTYGLPVNITRCSNNYGPYQFPEKLIPLMINNCLEHRKLPVYGDGLQIRDWLYVEDHCRAIDLVLRKGKDGEVYNIGGHNERTNLSIIESIIGYVHDEVDKTVGSDLITHVADRKGHDQRYGIDPAKIHGELGWLPETRFEDGIRKTVGWYLSHRKWMEDVTSGSYMRYYQEMYGKE